MALSFRCDIFVVFYRTNKNTTKIYFTVLYNMFYNYMFRPFFRPSSGYICLALRVMYHYDKVADTARIVQNRKRHSRL